MRVMGKSALVFSLTLLVLFSGFSSASATSPAKIVSGLLSNVFSFLVKRLWSLKATTKTAITGRSMMKFESGYNVETVFDGSKLGIEPFSVEVLPSGELLVLDSANSNLYKISSSLSQYSRPKLVSGSAEGYYGHVDGKLREARMNHPKGLTVDDKGNIYIADTMNMAIRKISDSGIAVLVAAGFVGYMLAMLQHRVNTVDSSQSSLLLQEEETMKPNTPPIHYQKPLKSPVRPPLIPTEHEQEKQEQDFSGSLGKLVRPSMAEILGTIFPGFRKKPMKNQNHHQQQQKYSNSRPVQESFVIPDDEPPSIETRTPTPRKTYPFMSNDTEKMQKLRQSRAFFSEWDGDFQQQQTKKPQHQYRQHQNFSPTPQTYCEQSYEKTDEILFGAVQQDEQREAVIIKPLDYGNPVYDRKKTRSRIKSMSYAQG